VFNPQVGLSAAHLLSRDDEAVDRRTHQMQVRNDTRWTKTNCVMNETKNKLVHTSVSSQCHQVVSYDGNIQGEYLVMKDLAERLTVCVFNGIQCSSVLMRCVVSLSCNCVLAEFFATAFALQLKGHSFLFMLISSVAKSSGTTQTDFCVFVAVLSCSLNTCICIAQCQRVYYCLFIIVVSCGLNTVLCCRVFTVSVCG